MDNITHSLFALTLAGAGLRRAGRGSTATLLIASNIPDIEVLTTLTGGRVGYLAAHRGPTHGPLGLGLAAATALLVWLVQRRSGRREQTASLAALAGVAAIGFVGHVALDFATSYGTRVLSPLWDGWVGVDWMPILDVYLWVILAAGLVAAARRPALRARLAAAALVLMAGDYAVRATAHSAAMREAVAIQSRALPGSAENDNGVFHYLGPAEPAALPAALPTLASPFRWRVIVRVPGGFEVREISLLGKPPDGEAIAFPDQGGAMVARASTAPMARVFLDFSRFPSAEAITHRNGDVTVHWYDMRFARRPEGPGDGRRHTSPFGAWVRMSPDGTVVGQGLGPG